MGGIEGLFNLCLKKAGITLEDIRRLHLMRPSTLNPAIDMIDKMAGPQYNMTRDASGPMFPSVIGCKPERATYQIVIYGELFASTWKAILQPELKLPRFDIEMRLEYIRYCVPDIFCMLGNPGMKLPEPTGPYVTNNGINGEIREIGEDQVALQHILKCERWVELWRKACGDIGYFRDHWRQKIWESVVQCQGLEGLQMITGGVEKWSERLTKIRNQIEKLEKKPKEFKFGPYDNPGSEYPDMAEEVFLLVAGYWQYKERKEDSDRLGITKEMQSRVLWLCIGCKVI
jgi:hypothetical protein